jgi:hypothetical protein
MSVEDTWDDPDSGAWKMYRMIYEILERRNGKYASSAKGGQGSCILIEPRRTYVSKYMHFVSGFRIYFVQF